MTAASKQSLDFVQLPGGAVKAVLTVTLPGGITRRFESITTPHEAESVEGEIVGAELALGGPAVVGAFRPFKALKKVGKLAKGIATSKVFKAAAAGLALAAPLLGPLAPAALAASAGMGVASKLAGAGVAAAKGAANVARALTTQAVSQAQRATSSPEAAAALLALADKRRLGAEKLADAPSRAASSAPSSRAVAPSSRAVARAPSSSSSAPARMSDTDLLARARAGLVRSNWGGVVNPEQLLEAHRAGRVFWVLS